MATTIFQYLLEGGRELAIFLISTIPIVELRGAIPLGIGIGMPWYTVLIWAVLGNCLPIPFVLHFGHKVMHWLSTKRTFEKPVLWYQDKLRRKRVQVTKYAKYGLFIFVAIPLPGTGAWSGSLIATLLDMPKRKAAISIALGVIASGIIMLFGSHMLVRFIQYF